MKDFRAGTKRFSESRQTEGHDHELLQVNAAVGVGAAIQDVHHGSWQHVRIERGRAGHSRQRPIDRLLSGSGGGPGSCHRHTQQRIRAEPALGGCAVEFDERGVELR